MNESYLEVTFRRGHPVAAPGMVVDHSRSDRPIGIEITAPTKLTLAAPNRVLRKLGFPAIRRADLAPLRAA